MKYIGIDERDECCANCRHFIQHYAIVLDDVSPINAGHCVYPKVKSRRPSDRCDNFTPSGEFITTERRKR